MSETKMSEEKPDDIDEDGLAIFSLEDENIDELGKILSIKYSRDFYSVTLDGQFNLKEIAKKVSKDENPRLPNATHHKDRLLKTGLIKKEKKLQRKKGHVLNYYKGKPFILIIPKEYEDQVKKSKDLKKVFANMFNLTLSGIIAVASLGLIGTTKLSGSFG
ncbi:unnamed protein product, partial [marine sediment metagenome]